MSQEGGEKFGEYLETRIELKQKRGIEKIMEDFENDYIQEGLPLATN